MQRNRKIYLLLIPFVMGLGILSRKFSYLMPDIINTYLGDAIWATMIYVMMAFVFAHKLPKQIAVFSLLFCYAIELSQLYQAPWINAIRSTTIGALVLGSGFLWSDLLAYALGILSVTLLEMITIISKTKVDE
jgi:NO-binding membrane sensor protein with MHYT domain